MVTGVSDGIYTEIVSGLSAGDKVVTGMASVSSKASGAPATESGEESPFMPKRPNDCNKKDSTKNK